MDFETIINILTVLIAIFFPIGGWFVKVLHSTLKEHRAHIEGVEQDLANHKLYAAENFTTKRDLKEMVAGLVEHLRRIEDKLDRKVDK